MEGKTLSVKLVISEELKNKFEEANEELKKTVGFAPGAEFLMAMSLAKDSDIDDIISDFFTVLRHKKKSIEKTDKGGLDKK